MKIVRSIIHGFEALSCILLAFGSTAILYLKRVLVYFCAIMRKAQFIRVSRLLLVLLVTAALAGACASAQSVHTRPPSGKFKCK